MATGEWNTKDRIQELREEGIAVPDDLDRQVDGIKLAVSQNMEVFGPNHPEVALALENLGLALYSLGDLSGARLALEDALAMNERIFGTNDVEVARTLYHLGLVLKSLGQETASRTVLVRSRTILISAGRSDHKLTAGIAAALSKLHGHEGSPGGGQ